MKKQELAELLKMLDQLKQNAQTIGALYRMVINLQNVAEALLDKQLRLESAVKDIDPVAYVRAFTSPDELAKAVMVHAEAKRPKKKPTQRRRSRVAR